MRTSFAARSLRTERGMDLRRAVFLDRDGVINPLLYHRDAGIVDSPFTVEQFTLFPRAGRAIRLLNELGLPVVLVSNQPGIAKGHFTISTLRAINAKMQTALARSGAHLDALYYCLHHPNANVKRLRKKCACRKPGIALLTRAVRELRLDLENSYMVGDGLPDMEAGARAGCRTIFIGKWKCEQCQFMQPPGARPAMLAADLWAAAQRIRSDFQAPAARLEASAGQTDSCPLIFANG